MVVFNPVKREIDIKVVYYGPALCGKTTNIQAVHKVLNPRQRGELVSLATKDDRTLFFDFLPIELDGIKGFKTRFHIYTVPGQVFYTLTRRAVLTGVDGIVFVADSQTDKMGENTESLNDLKENLKYYSKELELLPFVIQYNKRDLDGVMPVEEMERELNKFQVPSFVASALSGKGVMETLTMCCRMVLKQIKDKSTAKKVVEMKEEARAREKRKIEEVISELPSLKLVEFYGGQGKDDDTPLLTDEGDYEQGGKAHDQREKIAESDRGTPSLGKEPAVFEDEGDRQTPESTSLLNETQGPLSKSEVAREREAEALGESLTKEIRTPKVFETEEDKRTCPRCSLKFKSNVKRCPICKINLVPEETKEENRVHDEVQASLDRTLLAEPPPFKDTSEASRETEERQREYGLEIIACGQPKKVSPVALTIPLIMKINAVEQEFVVNLTINFNDFALRSKE